jgi:hypothetical protein
MIPKIKSPAAQNSRYSHLPSTIRATPNILPHNHIYFSLIFVRDKVPNGMMIYSKRRAHHALSGCRPII